MVIAHSLIFLMVLVGVLPMAWEMKKGKFDFFNLKNPFILYYVVQLGASGLITFITEQPSEIGLDPLIYYNEYIQTLLLSIAGLITFQLGYYTSSRRPLALPQIVRLPWRPGRHLLILLLYSSIGLCALWLLFRANGGFSQFLIDREFFRSGGMIGQGIFLFPCTSMLSTATLIYFLSCVRVNPRHPGVIPILLFILSITPAYFLGFRGSIILPALQFLVVWRYGYRPIPSEKLAILLIFIMIGFTAYGFSREIPAGIPVDIDLAVDILTEKPELAIGVLSRSKGLEVVTSVVATLDQTGEYEFGWKGVMEAGTIIIPKIIWASKPIPSSERFTTYFFGKNLALSRGHFADKWGGISPTVVGELFWNFGFAGVLIGLFLLGRIASIAYATLLRNIYNPSVIICYAIFFTSFSMFAEAIQGYLNGLVMYAFLLTFTFYFLCLQGPSEPQINESRDI